MYFKFENKKAALDFCLAINEGENIHVTEDNVTTGYAQPFEYMGSFYVIADDVTSKYTDLEPIDLFAPVDYTPPTPTGLRVAIPAYWEMLFPDDKFIIGGFVATLERVEDTLAVDIAYLKWVAFREELFKPEHAALARQMGAVMRYLEKEATNNNFI